MPPRPLTLRNHALPTLLALAALACTGGGAVRPSDAGSGTDALGPPAFGNTCTVANTDGQTLCVEFGAGYPPGTAQGACAAGQNDSGFATTMVSTGPCTSAMRVAHCAVTGTQSGLTFAYSMSYYGTYRLEDARTACTQLNAPPGQTTVFAEH